MGCCGQQRAELSATLGTAGQNGAPVSNGSELKIEFKQRSPMMVRGPSTGRHYQFAPESYAQMVDARDAHALIESGYFRRAET
jgi:hypothetical protein